MPVFLAATAGLTIIASIFFASSQIFSTQFLALRERIEESLKIQVPVAAVLNSNPSVLFSDSETIAQGESDRMQQLAVVQTLIAPVENFPPQTQPLYGAQIYTPENTYTTINSKDIEQRLLIQKNYFSKQMDRIYDRIKSNTQDVNDRVDSVTTTSSGISFATIALGGTGISTVPSYGQLLMGDGSGGYTLIATSSLGISGGGGSSQWTTVGSNIFYSGGSVVMDSFSATSTATSTMAGGLSVNTATSSGVVTLRPTHSGQPALAIIKNQSLSATSPLQTWDMVSSDRQTLVDQYGLKINRIGSNTININYSTSQNQSYNNYSLLVDGTLPGIFLRSSQFSGTVTTMHLFNGSIDLPTTNGSSLGGTQFYGTDIGGGYREAASISAVAESDFTILPRVSPPRTGNGRGALVFSTNDDAVSTFGAFRPTERMRINSLGNVGIGTTSPYAKLSVAGSIVMDSFSATSTATSTITGGLSVGTATSSGLVTLRSVHSGQPAIAVLRNTNFSAATPLQTWETSTASRRSWFDGNGLKINTDPTLSNAITIYRVGDDSLGSIATSIGNYSALIDAPTTYPLFLRNTSGGVNQFFLSGGDVTTIQGTNIGSLRFVGNADIGYREVARFNVVAETNFGGAGSSKASMVFSTNDDLIPTGIVGGFGTPVYEPRERMRIASNGNIGIASTSPFAMLSIMNGGSYLSQAPSTSFAIGSSTMGLATSTHFIVTSEGRVGIGTTSPQRSLHVVGSGIISERASADPQLILRNSGYSTTGQDWNFRVITGDGSFVIRDGTGPTQDIFTMTVDANVGISTSTPYAKLSVAGGGVGTTTMALRPALGQTANIVDIYNTTGSLVSVVNNMGNFGIGTSAPAYPLHVASTTLTDIARFSGSGGTQCTVVTGTGFSCTSDERFKTHIATIDSSALQKVLKLRPVNFNWKYDPEGQIQIGFIAQELEEIFPELVRNDSSGYKSVAYAQLTPLLVKAIQEQNISVEKLSLILDSQDPLPKIFIDRIVAAISQVSNLIVKTITADSVRTKELCVEDVCVTREQFLKMIRDSGARESAPRQDKQDSQEENSQNSTEQDTQQEESDELQDQDENEQNDDGNDESTEENGGATVDESTENSEEQAVNNEDQVIADTPETTEAAPDDQTDSQTQDGDSGGGADEGQEESVSEQSEPSHESSTEDSGTDGAEGGSAGDSNVTE